MSSAPNTLKDFFRVPKRTYYEKVILIALATFFVLVLKHKNYVPLNTQSARLVLAFVPRLLLTGWSDGIFLLTIGSATLLSLYLSRNKPILKRVVYGIFIFLIALALFAAVVNPIILNTMRRPLTYKWLYYSDFLNSTDAKNAVKANLDAHLLKSFIFTFGMQVVLFWLFSFFYAKLPKQRASRKNLTAVFLVIAGVYFISFQLRKDRWRLSYLQFKNPISYFVNSIFEDENPALFSTKVQDVYRNEFIQKRPLAILDSSLRIDSSKAPIKNVILFVMESVASKYVDAYGCKYGVTPNLDKLAGESIRYNNVYAHTPTTHYSLVSLLSSTYPILSYRGITAEHTTIPIPTISSELKKRGYRTGFFNAGDIRFQKCDAFLTSHQFDEVQDYRDAACREHQFIVDGDRWDNPDGADDQCIVRAFDQWLPTVGKAPFFATLWTVQTHYPYVVSGAEKDYCSKENKNLNRYLNALHHADESLADLINTLKKYKLDESTLVVVIGDHGEAFGEHEQFGHGAEVYEENIRIPLFFINRNLFKGEQSDRLTGQVDIAPSIMDVLQYPSPASWQGESMFRKEDIARRIYFFCPWSNYLFGYRDSRYKYIFNASTNSDEVYDLESDPLELNNLSKRLPRHLLEDSHQRLAAWAQYQNSYFNQIEAVGKK